MNRNQTACIPSLCLLIGILACYMAPMAKTVRLQNGLSYYNGTYTGAEDCYLRQPYPDAATGKFPEIIVGFETFNGGGKDRALIRFNVSDINSALISTSHVTSAKITLTAASIDGAAITNKTVYMYQVSSANKAWASGSSTTRITAETGAASWNWIAYDNTNYAPNDAVNCPNPTAGCPRRNPWAGDVTAYRAVWPTLTTFKGNACGIPTLDYINTPVASASITAATGPGSTQMEFTIADPALILSWIKNSSLNSGLYITCPDLEIGSLSSYSTIRFASSEHVSLSTRPMLTLEIDTLNAPVGGITYSVPGNAKVSMHISDASGKIVKELLFASPRNSGENIDFWDCKTDPEPQRTGIPQTVPDGNYKVKILKTQGLRAEYICNVGASGTIWPEDQFPGNHTTPGGLAVDSANSLYIGASTSETHVALRKQNFSGTALWVKGDMGGFAGLHTMAVMKDTIYGISPAGQYVVYSATQPASAPVNGQMSSRALLDATGFSGAAGWDIAARNGHVLVANHISSSICWITPRTGVKIGSPIAVANLHGIGIDSNGDAIVLSGTSLVKYVFGSTTATPIAALSTNLSTPNRMDINPTNGDIYVLDYGTMQVKVFSSAGAFKKAIGTVGGRKPYGTYNPADGFYHGTSIVTPDIAVARDGSFFIAEQEPMRRVAHYEYSGTFIKEWYCGGIYAVHSTADADDPRIIWVCNNYNTIMRCEVDYLNQTWKVLGNYRTNKAPLNEGNDWSKWNCVKRGGKTFLVSSQFPVIYYFDQAGDSLRAIAVAGNKSGIAGSWADLNGDGQIQSTEQIAAPSGQSYTSNCCSQIHGINAMDSNFASYGNMMNGGAGWVGPISSNVIPGPSVYRPKEIRTVNGVPTPIYDLKDLSQPFASNRTQMCATMTNWVSQSGGAIDNKGGVYSAYPFHSEKFSNDSTNWYPNSPYLIGGMKLVKGDLNTGKISWAVGRYSTTVGNPSPGQLCLGDHMLGFVRGCVALADMSPLQYVYDEDGLYVGRFFDTRMPKNNKPLPASDVLTCGEQFGGSAFEVKRSDIPGLAKGDVIFLSASTNCVAIMRISGFDNMLKDTTSVTVRNGAIVAQGSIAAYGQQGAFVGVRRENGRNLPNTQSTTADLKVITSHTGATIIYSMPEKQSVSLDIFDLRGRKVTTLLAGVMNSGTHTMSWNGSQSKTGAGYYILRLKIGAQSIIKNFTLIE